MSETSPAFRLFVGIDWGATQHQVCCLPAEGGRPQQREFPHSPEGLARLVSWLRERCGDPAGVAAAIETPFHPVVDALLEAGVAIHSLNPKQLDRFRDRHTVAGAKDDRRDAYVLADSLRTDRHLFRQLAPLDPATAAIREAHRTYHTLQEDLRRQANRLGELLQRYAPALLALERSASEPYFWDVLTVGLDPARAKVLRRQRVEALLKRHHKRAVTAGEVLEAVRAPRLQLREGIEGELLRQAGYLVAILKVTHESLRAAEGRLTELVRAYGFEAEAIDSLPGAAVIVTATLLGEAHDAVKRPDLNNLRARCGTAPVTRQSGKSRTVGFRRACNPYLRNACWDMARAAVRSDPWARQLYIDMTNRGLPYDRALRGVADRLLTRLVALLKTRTLYDPIKAKASRETVPLP